MLELLTPFINHETNETFLTTGFASFDLLNEEDVDFILRIFQKANSNERFNSPQFYGVNYSLGTLSALENQQMMKPVEDLLTRKLEQHFKDFETIGFVFITKPPHTATTFVYHQDWNYTDENKYAFATCWIPLCDVTPQNGGMSFISGSHRFSKTFRSDSLPSARIAFDEIPVELRTDVSLKKGTCVAFHQGIFHGSYPNSSDESRPVLAVVAKPAKAPIAHYVKQDDKIQAFEMDKAGFNQMLNQIPQSEIPQNAKLVETLENIPSLALGKDIIAQWRIQQPFHRLFKNEIHHRTFIEQGFIKLDNLIGEEVIHELKKMYHENYNLRDGMYVTHHEVTDESSNKQMSQRIFGLIKNMLENSFVSFQPLISHFAAKAPGSNGLFNFHQDWSIIEEELFGVLHCWIPLQDTDKNNGTLTVLPGSHLFFHNYRSGTCPIRFTAIQDYEEYRLFVDAKCGDVVFYHPALFHGSGTNNSPTPRLAVVAALAHPQAKKVYYHQHSNGDAFAHELLDKDLFSRLDELAKGAAPTGNILKKVPNRALTKTDSDLRESISTIYSAHKAEADVAV